MLRIAFRRVLAVIMLMTGAAAERLAHAVAWFIPVMPYIWLRWRYFFSRYYYFRYALCHTDFATTLLHHQPSARCLYILLRHARYTSHADKAMLTHT